MTGGRVRSVVRVVLAAVVVALGVYALTASDGAIAPRAAAALPSITQAPAGFEANSTQAVCALTGSHGAYGEGLPGGSGSSSFPHGFDYTDTDYGVVAGDSGSSFVYDGEVWWLFGNTSATQTVGGLPNASKRWPKVRNLARGSVALDSDSIATSPLAQSAPAPGAPYDGLKPPPDQLCPVLSFLTQTSSVPSPYTSPSLSPDPLFPGAGYSVSLRTGELPEAGISEGNPAQMYVVFGTDSPSNCATISADTQGPCAEPTWSTSTTGATSVTGATSAAGVETLCAGAKKSRTRSVMAVYTGAGVNFKGLYDLSAPSPRYWPTCPTKHPSKDLARFVNVQMADGADGYVYIWGTEGGANNERSPVYLARIMASNIATGQGIEYWDHGSFVVGQIGTQPEATPVFTDSPKPCVGQLGIQDNPYLNEWIMLYHCNEPDPPAGRPNGIYMRTAPNPQGPWSAPTTIFNPAPDPVTRSGYCYFIYSKETKANPDGSPKCPDPGLDATLADKLHQLGAYYGPYFVANWTTGNYATASNRATTTIYYTLDTYDPYGQLIMRSTILGPALAITPPCKRTQLNCGQHARRMH
jgi:hypothetical protein